jgi:hypothetical protein
MEKVIILDGISSIIKNQNFIKDSIPRVLAKYVDDKYKLWLRPNPMESNGILDYICVPFWLKQSIITVNDNILENLKDIKFSSDSFVISNDTNKDAIFKKFKLRVYSSYDIFSYRYNPLNIADIILCFGFEDLEFKKLCNEANLLEFGSKTLKTKKYNGVAFSIKSDNLELEYKDIIENFQSLIKSGKYTIKHKEYVIGLTSGGLGIEGLNLNIINGKSLPLILI